MRKKTIMSASKELMLTDSDIGKKVYEIEQEIARVIMEKIMAMILFQVQKNTHNIKEQH